MWSEPPVNLRNILLDNIGWARVTKYLLKNTYLTWKTDQDNQAGGNRNDTGREKPSSKKEMINFSVRS